MSIEPKRVEFDGGRLVGDRWTPGDRDPVGSVVFLHGGGQTRHSWAGTAAKLAGHGWQAVTLDLRGHGDSAWAADGDYSIDALVEDLRIVTGAFSRPPVLVGASLGGMTALIGTGENDRLGSGLVLVDIVPRVESAGISRIVDFMTSTVDGFDSVEGVADAVQAYNPGRHRAPRPEGLLKNVRRHTDGRWYWHWDPALLRIGEKSTQSADLERAAMAAPRVKVPVLVVRGGDSDVVSDSGVRDLLERLPDGRGVDVPGAGHMIAGDDNDAFTDHVAEFLTSLHDSIEHGR